MEKWSRAGRLLASVAGGRNEGHTVFCRCAAPEKIRIDRTGGSSAFGTSASLCVNSFLSILYLASLDFSLRSRMEIKGESRSED